jgi:hypothetical protein
VFVPTPIQPPESPRVRELSQQIQQLLSDFQRRYPMTPAEIRQALLHAAGATGGHTRPILALVAGGLAALLGIGVFASRSIEGGGGERTFPVMLAIGIVIAGVGLVVMIKRSR